MKNKISSKKIHVATASSAAFVGFFSSLLGNHHNVLAQSTRESTTGTLQNVQVPQYIQSQTPKAILRPKIIEKSPDMQVEQNINTETAVEYINVNSLAEPERTSFIKWMQSKGIQNPTINDYILNKTEVMLDRLDEIEKRLDAIENK